MRLLACTLAAISVFASSTYANAQARSLEDALALAQERSNRVAVSEETIRLLESEEDKVKSEFYPQVRLDANYSELIEVSSNSFTAPDRFLTIRPDVLIPLYDGGRRKAKLSIARNETETGRRVLLADKAALVVDVSTAYVDTIRDMANLELAKGQVSVLEETLSATERRQSLGDLTLTDVAQARARLLLADSDLQRAESNLSTTREIFRELVGVVPRILLPPPPLPAIPEDVDTAVQAAMRNNYRLMEARSRQRAAEETRRLAKKNRNVAVDAFVDASYSNFFETLGGPIAANFEQSEFNLGVGVRLSVPIYEGGRLKAERAVAASQSNIATLKLRQIEEEVVRDLRTLYAAIETIRARAENAENAIEAAKLALRGVTAEETIGNRTILDVLNAQQELLRTRVLQAEAERDLYVAKVRVINVIGKSGAGMINAAVVP